MHFEPHLGLHMQVFLTTWFIVMLSFTSDPGTRRSTRKAIQGLNAIMVIVVIILSFNSNFH